MGKLKTKAVKDLIPIFGQKIEQESVETVNARDVWEFLEVKRQFSKWIQEKIKNYDFVEGVDYVCQSNLTNKGEEGRNKPIEYYVSLDMAKELSMVQNNPKGKEARLYFIQCEKIAKAVIAAGFRKKDRQLILEWKQAREEGKISRRVTTDHIKKYEELAKGQGSKNPQNYSMMSNWIYDGTVPDGHMEVKRLKKELGLENGRDGLPIDILRNVEYGEGVIFPAICKKVTEEGGDYKEIKKMVKSTFLQLRSFLMLPPLQNNTKSLTN